VWRQATFYMILKGFTWKKKTIFNFTLLTSVTLNIHWCLKLIIFSIFFSLNQEIETFKITFTLLYIIICKINIYFMNFFQYSYCKLVMTFCLWFCVKTAVYFRSFRWHQLSLASLIHGVLLSLPQPNKINHFIQY